MEIAEKSGLTADMLKVFETLPNMYLILSADLMILTASQAYLTAVNKKSADVQGKFIFDVFYQDNDMPGLTDIQTSLQQVLHTKKAHQLPVTRYDLPDPADKQRLLERYWLSSHTPVLNTDGQISYIIHQTENVTDLIFTEHKAKAVLRPPSNEMTLSEQRFAFLLNAMPQQVWTARPDGTLDYVNEFSCTYFGKDINYITDHGWQAFVHPQDIDACLKTWQTALETGKEYMVEFRLQMHTGAYKWHLGRAVPLIENGLTTLWLGTNINIDLQKNNEQKKDEFLSIASHELKTPLTSIKAFNQLMQRTSDPEKLNSFIHKSAERIFRLEKLINDLLDVTRINAGKMIYNLEEFNFSQMLRDSIESVQYTSPSHRISLECENEVLYTGDRFRIEQVVNNFLTNAIKYSPGADKILVKSSIQLQNIILSVQDFGIGIPEQELDRLFERYYRADNSAMRFEGLGLGLFISSEILKGHQGSFWIESEPDQGSTFYFRLPLPSPENAGPEANENHFYKDNTISITYNPDKQRLEVDWLGFQNLETVQHGCQLLADRLQKTKVHKILNDNNQVLGTWSEASEWVGKSGFPMLEKSGLQYFAWVFSPIAFSQLSARKSVDIAEGNVITQLFTDLPSARKWLDSK